MRSLSFFSLVLVIALGALALTFGAARPASLAPVNSGRESQIREVSRAWDAAFNAEDISALMALYADGAVSMPPGAPALEGKAVLRSDFEYVFATYNLKHETTIVDLLLSGNVAVERGSYTMSEGGEIVETGKHIVLRQKHGNTWLVVWEIWNVDGATP